jgi:hypothetical protein
MRVLYLAQERARDADGRPTFPELFEHDARGESVLDNHGNYARRDIERRQLRLPTFHPLRHGAAMDRDDADEARDRLRRNNSNVTRAIYRAHFGDRRRELLRARMEEHMETRLDEPQPHAIAAHCRRPSPSRRSPSPTTPLTRPAAA